MQPSQAQKSDIEQRLRAAAQGWLGTPFVRLHGKPGVGCDCGNLVYGCLRDAGMPVPDLDIPTFGLSRDVPFTGQLQAMLDQIPTMAAVDGEPLPGDILVFAPQVRTQHMVLVIAWPQVLQTWPGRKAEIAVLDGRWESKRIGHYRVEVGQ